MIRYAHYFNSKYKRTGSILQNRFKSKNIETKDYFLRVCRYVHRNPENAGICKTEDYQWSSYKEYLQKEKLIDKKILLYYFNNSLDTFIQFTKNTDYLQDLEDLADYELLEKLTDEQVIEKIRKILKIQNIREIKDYDKKKRNEKLQQLKVIEGTTKVQISRILGINRKIIERAIERRKWG